MPNAYDLRKLGNTRKMLLLSGGSLVSSQPSRNETLLTGFKADIKVFWSCPMLLDSFILFKYFVRHATDLNKFA